MFTYKNRPPTFQATTLGPWYTVISYDACVRLCLRAWPATHCYEATMFLENECSLLRDAFGLRKTLLQPEEDLIASCNAKPFSSEEGFTTKPKWGIVAETKAYDLVLEVAMKVQGFQQRNLLLHGPWKWLLSQFASYYGVSETYTKLRYLSYVMDVATPTADCLNLVHDLLEHVISNETSLSDQENRILGETKDEIERILAFVFENYKSLDESSFSGITETLGPAAYGDAAPVMEPAVKLYKLLHDISSPEARIALCHHFQVAAEKRARRHLGDTDEYIAQNNEASLMDPVTKSIAYQKMTTLCKKIRDEIETDIQIHNQNILPSIVDLPSLSASVYSIELYKRLRAFLLSCPPAGPSSPVAELVNATSDFQGKLSEWKIEMDPPIKRGVNAKELFHPYIPLWIKDKRSSLLESCKLDKVIWSDHSSKTPFVDDMCMRLKETLRDYEVIISHCPEYTFNLENAIADIEEAVVKALDKQYADVLRPLKETMTTPNKFGLKYLQKIAKRSTRAAYLVTNELGILLNSFNRMLDILLPSVESYFKEWGSRWPHAQNTAPGERLSQVTVMLRAKFSNYLQAIVEKLVENTNLHDATKLSKDIVVASDLTRLQPLKDQLANTIGHLHSVFDTRVFISICRGYWDQIGREILSFLDNKKENNRKENISRYNGSRVVVSILDATFASQMQQLLGNAIHFDPPRYIMELHSIFFNDAPNHKDFNDAPSHKDIINFYYQGKCM